MSASLSGIGFNGYRVPSRSGTARNARQAGGHTHLAAVPSSLVYDIAPNRIPTRDGLHGVGFYDAGGLADQGDDFGSSSGFTDGGWDGWGPSFSGNSGIDIGSGFPVGSIGGSGSSGVNNSQQNTTCAFITARDPGAIVDQVEPLLKANVAAYLAGQKTQAQALAFFDQVWQCVQSKCGAACTADRQAGAAKWHDSAGLPWNWFSGYRDPISRGGTGTTGTNPITSLLPGVTAGDSSIYLMGIGLLILVAVAMGGKH